MKIEMRSWPTVNKSTYQVQVVYFYKKKYLKLKSDYCYKGLNVYLW